MRHRRRVRRRWFTFFWIPLIPLKVLGEFVACTGCGAQYDVKVLTLPTTSQLEDQLTRALRHVTVAMIHADAHVDDAELAMGVEVVNRFGLQTYDVTSLREDLATLQIDDLEHELAQVASMLSPQGQEAVIQACLMLAGADGDIDETELQMVVRAGRSIGMSPAHIRGVLHEVTSVA